MPARNRGCLLPLVCLLTAGLAASCTPQQEASGPVDITGESLRVSLQEGSPLVDALRLRLNQFEEETGATVALETAAEVDREADLCVVSGTRLGMLHDLPTLTEPILEDNAVNYLRLPPRYRLTFDKRNGDPVAVPLGTAMVTLWVRADLMTDPELDAAYREVSGGQPLGVPETWQEVVRVARFLQAQGAVDYGYVAATTPDADGVRILLAHCAAFARGPNWSGFTVDTETGRPLVATPAFVRGMEHWRDALATSPVAEGAMLDEASARDLFLDGRAAMLLSPRIPTAGVERDRLAGIADKVAAASLPGSIALYPPGAREPLELPPEQPNRCVHYAHAGWFVFFGTTPTPASERLMTALARRDESFYLVQAAREGLIPIRRTLLNEPNRFRAYGLPTTATSRFFAQVLADLQSLAWVCDFRVPEGPRLESELGKALAPVLRGDQEPAAALAEVEKAWRPILQERGDAFLPHYRDTLGLPPLTSRPAAE